MLSKSILIISKFARFFSETQCREPVSVTTNMFMMYPLRKY